VLSHFILRLAHLHVSKDNYNFCFSSLSFAFLFFNFAFLHSKFIRVMSDHIENQGAETSNIGDALITLLDVEGLVFLFCKENFRQSNG